MITPTIIIVTFFLTAVWTFAIWKLIPRCIRDNWGRLAALFVATWILTAYAGTKPDSPDPDPEPVKQYWKIYAKEQPYVHTNAIKLILSGDLDVPMR